MQRACRSGIISVSVLHLHAGSVKPIENPKQIAAWLVLDS
jgi:methyl coenzyme M reductase subunit C